MPAVNTAVSYYQSSGQMAATVTIDQRNVHFATQAAHAPPVTYNDLGTQGKLPNNRDGQLTAVMVRLVPKEVHSATANQIRGQDGIFFIDSFLASVQINNVELIRPAPVWCFPHPPMWIAGFGNFTGTGIGAVQNGGYMLYTINQAITPQNEIKVIVEGNLHTAMSEAMDYRVVIQVADNNPVNLA